jgi:hypothetical protein
MVAKITIPKIEYSIWIGFLKSLKNVAITVGIPALVLLMDNYVNWMPKEWYPIAVPLISIASYMAKNRIEFNNK